MLQGVLFWLAGVSLFGLTGFLFRDEISRERWFAGSAGQREDRKPALLRLVQGPPSAPEILEPIRR